MSRFPDAAVAGLAFLLVAGAAAPAADIAAGEKAFAKCRACHAVGEGAKNRVGPHLNELIGRPAGHVEGFSYSAAMSEAGAGGMVWDEPTLKAFLADPRGYLKGTKMTFAGLRREQEIDDIVAFLATFSAAAGSAPQAEAPAASPPPAPAEGAAGEPGAGAHFGLGRLATAEEVAAWDIDIRPDGLGLPDGHGTVAEGQVIYDENCAACHGDFGEAIGRWPVLAGGQGTLTDDRPEKTIGSYWPYLSTVYDYVRRAMPFGNARSLSDDEIYALTAYLLYLNDIVTDEDFELSKDNFASVRLPNEANFIDDDREAEPQYQAGAEPCMADCLPGTAAIRMHAAVLDVTPEADKGDGAPAAGIE